MTTMTPEIQGTLYWLVIITAFLSASLGLYLEFVSSAEVPFRYSIGFYLVGALMLLLNNDLFIHDSNTSVVIRIVAVAAMAASEIIWAYYVLQTYDVEGPFAKVMHEA